MGQVSNISNLNHTVMSSSPVEYTTNERKSAKLK
jgi:hypothetical protein